MLIHLGDKPKMLSGPTNEKFAIWKVRRQASRQFVLELHYFIMPSGIEAAWLREDGSEC
ncbi:MAG TPA: hypothetical protein VFA65_10205 [Bryobacteraceae bacterium]|nr:hypothetical protein [Bryobacteraceae bacterium]